MAGIVIALGLNAANHRDLCTTRFGLHKRGYLTKAYQLEGNSFAVSYFMRHKDTDPQVHVTDDIVFIAVGNMSFNNHYAMEGLRAAASSFRHDVDYNTATMLDGAFLFVVIRRDINRIDIVTDHIGLMTAYAYQRSGMFVVSTSSLALSNAFPVTPNYEEIAIFLRTASHVNSSTIYKEITVLEPASVYQFSLNRPVMDFRRQQYWISPTDVDGSIHKADLAESIRVALNERVAAMPVSDTLSDLSAGIDSRVVVSSLLSSHGVRATRTFTFGPPLSRERAVVRAICSSLRIRNDQLQLPPDWCERFPDYLRTSLSVTDGEESILNYAPILYAQEYKAACWRFSLNGLGGEVYRPFWSAQELFVRRRPANISRLIATRVLQYEFDDRIFSKRMSALLGNIKSSLESRYRSLLADVDLYRTYNSVQLDRLYLRAKLRRWAGRTISSSNQIVRTLSPLTDKVVITQAMTIPPYRKFGGSILRTIVERNAPELSAFPLLSGVPAQNPRWSNLHRFWPLLTDVPRRALRKLGQLSVKKTFLRDTSLTYDVQPWIANALSVGVLGDLLVYDAMLTRDLFEPGSLSAFVRSASQPGFRYHAQLGNLITLEMRMRSDYESWGLSGSI